MQSGKLNRRIQVQQQTTTQDAAGQELQSWATVYTCWANIDVQRSQLVYSTAEFTSKAIVRITMRWTSSIVITANMRILYTEPTTDVTHTYNVEAPLNTAQGNRELVILAYELMVKE